MNNTWWEHLMDQQRFLKWLRYAQMEGMHFLGWEEDRFYTEQQERFFQQYEQQMVSDAYLAGLLAEVVHEEA